MPPIPIYTKSPINAATADGVTPKTAASDGGMQPEKPSTTTATSTQQPGEYPAAQPGAVPHLPAVTQTHHVPIQPTPTSNLSSQGPPPPQPGAVPVAPGMTAGTRASGPPPPTTTAPARLPGEAPAAPVPYPRQMAIPPPTAPYSQRGTSTASVEKTQQTVLTYQLDHPPGYQQNPSAADMTSSQREASLQSAAAAPYHGYGGGVADNGDEEGVLGMAKKWAQTAGEKLSAAEQEVWKRINGKE
ncbi:hypothetical protein DL546_004376 [Coniochaeta pulveracea]|uniref:Uncharacterized protein n=1 Tax=Coniochaeta pulveracea TaxID=177199 RepID=A0A420YJM5_9PEZI|nr:hypothetical protein DL546_004376 [Coniochaeta pulveracea]